MSCIAVIDVETTGINPYQHDRIVEVAVVTMCLDGTIEQEFVSLVNPERDIGPTSVHGITASDVLSAPRFGEIVGTILDVVDKCVALAGHNFHFDRSFLTREFERLGHSFPEGPAVCTLQLAGGGTLSCCCAEHGIECSGQCHTALDDARATAQLLTKLLLDAPRKARELNDLPPIVWPRVPKCNVAPVTREASRTRNAGPPAYLQRLVARVQDTIPRDADDSTMLAYTALLDRVLEDRHVDDVEGDALCEVAGRWGIDGRRIRELHSEYLHHLAAAALADGVLTDAERRDLALVARLLGFEVSVLEQSLAGASNKLSDFVSPIRATSASPDGDLAGKRVRAIACRSAMV